MPARQLEQSLEPVEDWYVPVEQATQLIDPTTDWYWPVGQFVHSVAPAAEKRPAAQLEHVAVPAAAT